MAPLGLVHLNRATGDSSYTELMHMMWQDTQSCLYDSDEHMFYRDMSVTGDTNCNGNKVFWSHGNGWVMAGTARVLQYLSLDDPNRIEYATLLQEISARLKDIQLPDGYWHADLLGPNCQDNPETSGTGFFTFGIGWGINNGILDAPTYWPTVKAGWEALKAAVQPSGLLGYVQPVGAGPAGALKTSTNVYGVGAYLLAGSEVQKYLFAHDPNSIECFESYASNSALQAVWTDETANGTLSQVRLGDYGDNFMELTYQNDRSPYRSETVYTFASPKDFTAHDAYDLSVLVRGDTANAAEQLYVGIEDVNTASAVQVVTDPNVVQIPRWMDLGFGLSDFSGIDLTQVRKLTIGVGAPGAASPTSHGTMRIDNIRLFQQQCTTIPEDIFSDCKIDLLDFAVLADQWLDVYGISVEPMDPGLINLTAYWAFDDVSNGYAYDAVADQYNGQFLDDASWEEAGGKHGGAARFNGAINNGSRIEVSAAGLSASAGTIALWLRPEGSQSSPSVRYIFGHTSPATSWGNRIQLYFDSGNTQLDMGLGSTHALSTNNYNIPSDEWTHVALTWDGMNYQVYVNGQITSSGQYSGLSGIQSAVYIGNNGYDNPYEGFNGLIDEVRIYNTALGQDNVLYLAEGSAVVEIPDPPRPADLVLDGEINLDDLMRLLDIWIYDIHWP